MKLEDIYDIFLSHPVITTDTRDCPEGSIFFALKGDNFDGNLFAHEALEKGCAHAVVDNPDVAGSDGRMIYVSNVLFMLQDLAYHHRSQLSLPIVQITGTNGKTTTKELVTAVLAEKYRVLSTQGNLNNHIGVPKTLLRLTPDHQIAVIETGANHPGEIADLSKIVDATSGLITNIGRAHLEGFGSFEGVVQTKLELYRHLAQSPDHYVFVNGDDELLMSHLQTPKTVTYGSPGKGFDIEGEVLQCNPCVVLRWRVNGSVWHEVTTHLVGSYNLNNMLAAAAVGIRYGVSEEQISHALAHYEPNNKRSQLQTTEHNTLIVDAYNANPTSMKAAIDNFNQIEHPNKFLILGEMRELGASSDEAHAEVVAQLQEYGFQNVWLVGEQFKASGRKAGYCCFDGLDDVLETLKKQPLKEYLILVKGSNGTRLHQLPAYL
jgi:UDP-N-acetylmuramoyl-tripeptide--D-alanyl-D-alanine ligase